MNKLTERNIRMFVTVATADVNGTVRIGGNIYLPIETLKEKLVSNYGTEAVSLKDNKLVLKIDFRLAIQDGVKYVPPQPPAPDEDMFS